MQVIETRAKLEGERRQTADADLQTVALRLAKRRRETRELVRHHWTDHRARNLEGDPRLDANAAVVVLHADLPAREHLAAGEDPVLLEEGNVPLILQGRERLHRVVQVGKPAALRLLHPAIGIAVAREDDALVGLHLDLQKLLQIRVEIALHRVQLVAECVDGLCDDGVEHHLALRAVLRGTRCAELKLVAREGEWRSAVPVGGVLRQRRQRVHPKPHATFRPLFTFTFYLHLMLDRIEHTVQLVAEEHRDDRGRRLVRAKAMVVTRARRRLAQDVRMHLDRTDDREKERDEDRVLPRIRPGREEVPSAVGDGPVTVLAATVHALERLLVEKADEIILLRRLPEDLHDEHVVIDGKVQVLEHRRELELGRRDLVVPRLRRNAKPPETVLDLAHEFEDARLDRPEVVILELLMLRGRRAEDGASRLQEVGTLHIEALVDEEVLLLCAERHLHVRLRLAELPHEALRRARDRLDRPEKRGLHVERLAGKRTERGRNAECRAVRVPLDKRRRGRIPRRVATRLEGGAEPAGRKRTRVRFAAD